MDLNTRNGQHPIHHSYIEFPKTCENDNFRVAIVEENLMLRQIMGFLFVRPCRLMEFIKNSWTQIDAKNITCRMGQDPEYSTIREFFIKSAKKSYKKVRQTNQKVMILGASRFPSLFLQNDGQNY